MNYQILYRIKNYSYKIYYYDVNIYLSRLNNKRKKLSITKEEKDLAKHLLVAKLIKRITKPMGNKTFAKALSKIIKNL